MKWGELTIARKLYIVVGVMAVLIACELLTLRFAMNKLSAVRAFVGGEGTWSKAQKNAALSLQRYALTHSESDYKDYLDYLRIPEGDHRARIELLKPEPDMPVLRAGFIQGRIDPDDIMPMVDLLRRFYWVSYLSEAIAIWTDGDRLLDQFKEAGADYRNALRSSPPDAKGEREAFERIRKINEELTALEENFSNALGAGSRWMERVVISLLSLAVLMVESVGLTLTFNTSRRISGGLDELNDVAARIGHGDFSRLGRSWTAATAQHDEIGRLALSLEAMGRMLESSYRDLESRVSVRTAELGRALESRDEFLSIASHELKTPLSALLLQLQLAERAPASPDSRHLKSALTQTRRLARLIEDLLDLARIRAGKFELFQEDGDLRAVVAQAVGELAIDAQRAGSSISLKAGEVVLGKFDAIRMGQVVTNLVSNAIKYGQAKPIEVEIRSSGETAELTVRDRGVGIAPEMQGMIFERFERADAAAGISGLGLGLFVVRQIVGAHGGSVVVESRLGEGSAFTARIPLHPSTREQGQRQEQQQARA